MVMMKLFDWNAGEKSPAPAQSLEPNGLGRECLLGWWGGTPFKLKNNVQKEKAKPRKET